MPNDALAILRDDHQEVRALSREFEKEESDWFPTVREGLGRAPGEIGDQLLAATKRAPRSPAQPRALKKTIDAVLA